MEIWMEIWKDIMRRWKVNKFRYGSNKPINYLDIISVKKRFNSRLDFNGSLKADCWTYGDWEYFLLVLEGVKSSFLKKG